MLQYAPVTRKKTNYQTTLASKWKHLTAVSGLAWSRTRDLFSRHQLLVVSGLAGLFLILLIGSRFLQPGELQTADVAPKTISVATFVVGEDDLYQAAVGKVKNLSSLTLVAQTPGPISKPRYSEGDYVDEWALIATVASAYDGSNALSVSRQIAGESYTLAEVTYDNTVQVVSKTRELADANSDNTEELRKLSEASLDGTRNSVSATKEALEGLKAGLTGVPATDGPLLAQIAGLEGALAQSEASLASLEYQVSTDNPPTRLANLDRELVQLTTELQLKSAEIGKNIAWLGLRAAQVAEAATMIKAPFAGRLERVFVTEGHYVSPGTPVAKITGETQLTLVVPVAGSVAQQVDRQGFAQLLHNGELAQLAILHVSSTPTSGTLFEVLFDLPDEWAEDFREGETVTVSLPMAKAPQLGPQFVPVDAVFVTNTGRFVYVDDGGRAKRVDIVTDKIVGDRIEVVAGLDVGDVLLLDRSVRDGQPIESMRSSELE